MKKSCIIPITIDENQYQKYYTIGKRRLITIYINKPNLLRPNKEVEINWSCIGAVDIETVEQFSKELKKAVGIAKKERNKYDSQK